MLRTTSIPAQVLRLPPGLSRVGLDELEEAVSLLEPYQSFADVLRAHRASPYEWQRVQELAQELRHYGHFQRPLRVAGHTLVDGYHRLCALLECEEAFADLWVVAPGHPYPHPAPPLTERVVVLGGLEQITSPEKVIPLLVRSLPTPHGWANADIALLRDNHLYLRYHEDEALVDAALTVALGRLASIGVTAHPL